MMKKLSILLVSIVLLVLISRKAYLDWDFMLGRQVAMAKVLFIAPTESTNKFAVTIEYFNRYKNCNQKDKVVYEIDAIENISHNVNVIYSKDNDDLFIEGQTRITWGLVALMSFSSILVLLSVIVSFKNIFNKN